MKNIYLASSSPRREQILKELGMSFVISPPLNFQEECNGTDPSVVVCNNALGKAKEISGMHKDSIVIGCDTIVAFNNEFLGKPLTTDNAYLMLKKLSGNCHNVFSGLAVIDTQRHKELVGYDKTAVKFKVLSEKEIKDYVESGGPLDKAGAYGIQECGETFVESINGSFSNVVGLPKDLLLRFLAELKVYRQQNPNR